MISPFLFRLGVGFENKVKAWWCLSGNIVGHGGFFVPSLLQDAFCYSWE